MHGLLDLSPQEIGISGDRVNKNETCLIVLSFQDQQEVSPVIRLLMSDTFLVNTVWLLQSMTLTVSSNRTSSINPIDVRSPIFYR